MSSSAAARNGVAFALFLGLFIVYLRSVPDEFNTVYQNREFFDSDGEFITRQFRQGSIFTHNDHLLYHIIPRLAYARAESIPGLERDPVRIHKTLSALSGALGAALLFVFGCGWTRRWNSSLAAALLVSGCAGWWFFSATVDTYIPHAAASILALGVALRCARTQRMVDYAWLGAATGLAFLFRTDAFLLITLGGVTLVAPRRAAANLAAWAAGVIVVGMLGYTLLAYWFYDVPPAKVASWSVGHQDRPEAGTKWGVLSNLTWPNAGTVLANQAVYAVLLPGLRNTQSADVFANMREQPMGTVSLVLYGTFVIALAGRVTTRGWLDSYARTRLLLTVGLASVWFLSRTLFYTWWDPGEPFLFAVLSLPALWLLVITFLHQEPHEAHSPSVAARRASMARELLVWALTVIVWWHNWLTLIRPLRAL